MRVDLALCREETDQRRHQGLLPFVYEDGTGGSQTGGRWEFPQVRVEARRLIAQEEGIQ